MTRLTIHDFPSVEIKNAMLAYNTMHDQIDRMIDDAFIAILFQTPIASAVETIVMAERLVLFTILFKNGMRVSVVESSWRVDSEKPTLNQEAEVPSSMIDEAHPTLIKMFKMKRIIDKYYDKFDYSFVLTADAIQDYVRRHAVNI